jgi:hypothetical protein
MNTLQTPSAQVLGDVLTVIRDPLAPLGKRFTRRPDGSVEKHPQVAPTVCYARMERVPDIEALAALLERVGGDEHSAIINSHFLGPDVGEQFVILSENEIERRYGLKGREQTAGVHPADHDPEGCTKALGRFAENVAPSAWQILDRDTDEHTPPELAALDYDAWLARVGELLPGVELFDLARAASTSSRVLLEGKPVSRGNGHTWIKLRNPQDVERIRGLLPFRAMAAGLSWMKPRHSRRTGEVIGQSPATIIDPSVWSRGRVIFVGKPVVEGRGLTVAPQSVEIAAGLLGAEFPTDSIETPPPERVREIAQTVGWDVQIRSSAAGFAADAYDLTMATELDVKGQGLMTVREAAELLPAGGKLRCQAPFRASESWAGVLRRGTDGRLCVFDAGTHTTHWLNAAEAVGDDFEDVSQAACSPASPPALPAFKRANDTGAILATKENITWAVARPDLCGCQLRLDTFRDEVMVAPTAGSEWRPFRDTDYHALCMRLERGPQGFKDIAKEKIRDAVAYVAEGNAFDSAQHWLDGLVWDGTPRITTFLPTYFGAEDTPYTRAVGLYLWTAVVV